MPSVSVIIPARDAAETIGVQIEALCRQHTDRSFELIVADNGSVDDLARAVTAAAGGRPVRMVDASDVIGAAHARNRGASIAAGAKLLFCDADDEVSDEWLERMAAALEMHRFVGGGIDRRRFSPAADHLLQPVTEQLPRTAVGQSFAVTANIGIDRQLFDEVGGFDPDFVHGSEDVDFAIRCARVGVAPHFVEGATVHYRDPVGWRQLFARHRSYGCSEPQLQRKYGSTQPSRGLAAPLRFWGKLLLLGVASLWSPIKRDTAARMAGRGVGRVQGSIKHRALFL